MDASKQSGAESVADEPRNARKAWRGILLPRELVPLIAGQIRMMRSVLRADREYRRAPIRQRNTIALREARHSALRKLGESHEFPMFRLLRTERGSRASGRWDR